MCQLYKMVTVMSQLCKMVTVMCGPLYRIVTVMCPLHKRMTDVWSIIQEVDCDLRAVYTLVCGLL